MLAGALGGAASTVRLQPGGPAPATTGGLINLGNSCFMNASLQCMFHVPALWAALLKGVHGEQCRLGSVRRWADSAPLPGRPARPAFIAGPVAATLTPAMRRPWHCVTCAMEDICADVMRNCGATAPRALFQALPTISRSLTPGRQEDAHEFVRHLVDMMQRDMARAQVRPPRGPIRSPHLWRVTALLLCAPLTGWRPAGHPHRKAFGHAAGGAGHTGPRALHRPHAVTRALHGLWRRVRHGGAVRGRVPGHQRAELSDGRPAPLHGPGDAVGGQRVPLRRVRAPHVGHQAGHAAPHAARACHPPQALRLRLLARLQDVALRQVPAVAGRAAVLLGTGACHAPLPPPHPPWADPCIPRPQYKALPSYELYGVVSHSGSSPRSGHYTCLVRRSAKGGWMAKSDSFVRGASQDQALNSQAYMLFYVLPGKAAATVAAANGQAEPRHAAAAARTGTTNNNASPPRPRPMIGPPVPDWLRGGAGPGAAARAQDSSSSDGPAAAERGDSSDGSPPDWGPGAGLDAKGPPAVASPTSNPLRSAQPAWGRTPGLAEIRGNVAAGAAAKRVELARAPATTRPASPRRALPSHDQQAGPGTPVGTVRWPPQGGPAAVARRNTAMVPSQVRRQFSATHQGAAPAMVGNGAHSPHDTAHPPTAAPPSTALPGTAPPSAAPPSTAPATGMPAGAPSYSRPLNPLHGTVFVNDVPRMPDCAAAAKERSAAGGVGDAAQGAEARSGARENGVKRQGSEPDRSARERPSSHRKARSRSPRRWPESRNVSVSSDEGRSRSRGRSGGRGSAHRRRDNGESSHRSSHRSRDKGGSRDRGRGRDRGRARSRSRRHLHESRHRERSRSRSRKTSRRTPPSSSPSKKRSRSRRSRGSEDRKRSRRRHSERAEAEGEDGGKRRRHHKSKKGSKKRRGRRGDEDRA